MEHLPADCIAAMSAFRYAMNRSERPAMMPLPENAAAFELPPGQDLTYFREGLYGDLDWDATLDYMNRRYIQALQKQLPINGLVLLDGAAGFGWLSFAFLRAGGGKAILLDPDRERLNCARILADQLGLLERCSFICTALEDCNLPDACVDIFASIETLEHVGRKDIGRAVHNIVRCSRKAVLLTTPNALFPAIAHDCRLPFSHWLPKPWRKVYARLAGREKMEEGNDFLTPFDLRPLRQQFRSCCRFQTFGSMAEFLAFYPHYLPYGAAKKRLRKAPSLALKTFVFLNGHLLGRYAYWCAPNLANIWLRK